MARYETIEPRALVAPALAVLALLAAFPADARDPQGFLYGRVTTRGGETYEGRLRWGDQEAFWGDHFNSVKEERPWVDRAPRRERSEREPIKVLGITIGSRWERFSESRNLIARFGDIRSIEDVRGDEAVLVMKNGSRIEIDGGSNDVGAKIAVFDSEIGKVEVPWRKIERIDFFATPRDLEVAEHRLFGRLESRAGDFTGFIQWDQDECLSTDELDGDSRDGDLSIEMGKIRVIEKHTGDSSRVLLDSGREIVLDDSNDVDSDNRGIFVEDPRYGRVLVEWEAFERLQLSAPDGSGPRYDDFAPARPLSGKVTTEDGKVHRGRVVYDLDEAETWEILDGDRRDVRYHIPFGLIAAIVPESRDSSRIVLIGGEEIELEGTADVDDDNDGVLVLGGEEVEPVYVSWSELKRIDFDK